MLIPLGYQQLTDISSATALTVPDGARFAMIRAEAQDIRWRDDGSDPTATVGQLVKASDTAPLMYTGVLAALKFIAATTGAILNVSYYRQE